MRIIEINAYDRGSTGRIMFNIAETAKKQGHEVICFSTIPFDVYGIAKKKKLDGLYYFGGYFRNLIHYCLAQFNNGNGFFSPLTTYSLIRRIKKFQPDMIHLHNIHENCLSIPILFNFLKKNNIKVFWTFHDCWAFTGHCMHFDYTKCSNWKNSCIDCAYGKIAPRSRRSNSAKMWVKKKKYFSSLEDLTIITPSHWLADLAKQSYFNKYPIGVIHNGIDLQTFQPTESDFRKKYHCEDKFIVLGVAFSWGKRKGLDVFAELAERLGEKYQIVLVGDINIATPPHLGNIISISRTHNQKELAEIYTAADLFVNPSREEVFGTVNIEALACGTPVLTFKTGGNPEIPDATCGSVVPKDDIDAMFNEIIRISTERPFTEEACLQRAQAFNADVQFKEYVSLFEKSFDKQ